MALYSIETRIPQDLSIQRQCINNEFSPSTIYGLDCVLDVVVDTESLY